MTSDAPDEQNIRSLAELELSTALSARNRLIEEPAASFRWLIASLFAANGGALIALVGSDQISDYAKLWACCWFTVGIVFSLLTAWANQRAIQQTLPPLSNLVAFWGAVAHGMELDLDEHKRILADAAVTAKRAWPVQLFGWVAASLFIIGMIAAGSGFEGKSSKPTVSAAWSEKK